MPKFYPRPECLLDLVEQIIDQQDLESQFFVDVDIPGEIPLPAELRWTQELVESLIRQSTQYMPQGGELTIVGWADGGACELEISDSGAPVESRHLSSISPLAAASGAELIWQNCPQGGGAVTIRFDEQLRQRRAA